jgi:hypothetical protein
MNSQGRPVLQEPSGKMLLLIMLGLLPYALALPALGSIPIVLGALLGPSLGLGLSFAVIGVLLCIRPKLTTSLGGWLGFLGSIGLQLLWCFWELRVLTPR